VPVDVLNKPDGRGKQAASAAFLAATTGAYCPAGHGVPVQAVAPAAEKVPAGQGVQVACPEVMDPVGPK
jgi:hypothetical protein